MQGIGEEDLLDFTPELKAQSLATMEDYVMGGYLIHRSTLTIPWASMQP